MIQQIRGVIQFIETPKAQALHRWRGSHCCAACTGTVSQPFWWTLQARLQRLSKLIAAVVLTFIRKFATSYCFVFQDFCSRASGFAWNSGKRNHERYCIFCSKEVQRSRCPKIKSISTNRLGYATGRRNIIMQISDGKYCALLFLVWRRSLLVRCMADIKRLSSGRLNRKCTLSISTSQFSESYTVFARY